MAEVIPAILEKEFKEIRKKLGILQGLVKTVQIDLEDGIFVKNRTWFIDDPSFRKVVNGEETLPYYEDFDFEIDLMVADAVPNFDLYAKLGARRIIFHLEAVGDVLEFREFLEGMDMYARDGLDIGIAIEPSTPNERIYSLTSCINFVQFMGNDKIGHQGLELDARVYDKIILWREKYPDIPVAVDIGVNLETAPKLIAVGVEKLVIGSAIWGSSDIISTIKEFQSL